MNTFWTVWLPIILMGFVVLLFVGVLIWIFFFMRREKWYADIYEIGSKGFPFVSCRDVLIKREPAVSLQGRKSTKEVFMLKKAKKQTVEPDPRGVDIIKNKRNIALLHIDGAYVQLEDRIKLDSINGKPLLSPYALTKAQRKKYNIEEIDDKFYIKTDGESFIPLSKDMHPSILELKTIDHDVRTQTSQFITDTEEQYQNKMGWFERHQLLISVGFVCITFIIAISVGLNWLGDQMEMINKETNENQDTVVKFINAIANSNTKPPESAPGYSRGESSTTGNK